MNSKHFLLLALIYSFAASARQPSLCDFLDVPGCAGVTKQVRRLSSVSMPSPSTAANLNPAAVSFDRGLGFEVMHQNHNPLNFSLATGTGRIGGALISSNMENAFFGNRIPEVEATYFKRYEEKKQYRSQKLSLALGTRVIKQKNINLDAGVILKRHQELKRINPGMGVSLRLWHLYFGASYYQDDMFLNYKGLRDPISGYPYEWSGQDLTYAERFNVESYSLGTRLGNLSLDAGVIKTKYKLHEMLEDDTSKIYLYSAAYNYKNFLFNVAFRNEFTPGLKYIDGKLVEQNHYSDIYAGTQISFNKHFIAGLNYNYFLLRELSVSATLFF